MTIAEDLLLNPEEFRVTEERVGEGSIVEVFIAKNIRTNQLYAAKKIKLDQISSATNNLHFFQACEILAKLNHPCITKFYGMSFNSINNPEKYEPTYLTDYFPNGTLGELLIKGREVRSNPQFTSTKKIINLLGITHAMNYIHSQGVIHRNLTPNAILLDSDFYPHIGGFSLSRCFPHPLTKSMEFEMTTGIGTSFYMAPELIIEEDKYGIGVDIYAFSILAYELVTEERGRVRLASMIKYGERPSFNDKVTEPMKALISKCWCEDVDERPSFDEIYEKLSTDYKSYFSYDDVDDNEINDFIQMLNKL